MSENKNIFRPKARHIFTIWKDLIKDDFSALIELVKNAYDADATKIDISFKEINKENLKIVVSDDWHWMTRDDIMWKWLVPSTDNKRTKTETSKGRTFQWQKWIWRYAASVLGDKLEIESVRNGIKTIVNINWKDFYVDKFLDEVEIDIKTDNTTEKNWTKLTIIWNYEDLKSWKENNNKKEKLQLELSKLKSPFFEENDKFEIKLNYLWEKIDINVHELEDFFDYKIEWEVDENWFADFIYYNKDNGKEEHISKQLSKHLDEEWIKTEIEFPWKIKFKILVADLDSPTKDRSDVSKLFWRKVTNRKDFLESFKEHVWISIYRWNFRIRPYWEPKYDWLNLNSRRVNNPTMRLSTNQVLWYITIWNENESNLIEASSREWLKENNSFYGLVYELRQIISELERKRYNYRASVWLRKKKNKEIKIDEEINTLKNEVKNIESDKDKEEVIGKVDKVGEDFKKEKERLNEIIAQYEWHATLWKMLNITYHEISKPIRRIYERKSSINEIISKIKNNNLFWWGEAEGKIISLMDKYSTDAKTVHEFLKRLKPLAWGRWRKKNLSLIKILRKSFEMYKTQTDKYNIEIDLSGFNDFSFYWYETDFIVVFNNFIDNSIYWLNETNINNKKIKVESDWNNIIRFKDNWFWLVWLESDEEIDRLFEPWISLKEAWSGLWLSIAGEILERNNIYIRILSPDGEFNFILELKFQNDTNTRN